MDKNSPEGGFDFLWIVGWVNPGGNPGGLDLENEKRK
jgi:hypothetical protein